MWRYTFQELTGKAFRNNHATENVLAKTYPLCYGRRELNGEVKFMKHSLKPILFAGLVAGLTLGACNSGSPSSESDSNNAKSSGAEQPAVQGADLSTDVIRLQNEMVSAFATGNDSRFELALNAYVNDIDDRRAQRDFANELWTGSDQYEMNREMAVPLVEALSDTYDISSPTYLAGFAYWAGSGVEKDLGKALKYWARPGVEGNATVHYRRAVIYLDANLPYYDAAKGRALMVRAADMGNTDAVNWLNENP